MIADYLANLSRTVLSWLLSGIHLRIWISMNFILCGAIFVAMMESLKIETRMEKALVITTLISLSLLELLLLCLLWLGHKS